MLRVATYNTHDCVGRDRRYAPERIAGVLAELRADIIALQEITLDSGGAMHALLERASGLRAFAGTLVQRGPGRYGNVLLTRQGAPAGHRLQDLSVGSYEPRGLIDADLHIAGHAWRVLATHLGLAFRERRAQIARIAALAADDPRPTLLMGDLNVWLGVRALAPLRRIGFGGRSIGSFPTWLLPFLPLDRILVRGPASATRCWRHDSTAARIASDHFPIVAELENSAMGGAV